MPDSPENTNAPQHVLREAVLPVKLDTTEADRQIDALEKRLSEMKAPVGIGQGVGGSVPQAMSKDPMSDLTTVVKMLLTTNQLIEKLRAQMEDLTAAIERNQTGL